MIGKRIIPTDMHTSYTKEGYMSGRAIVGELECEAYFLAVQYKALTQYQLAILKSKNLQKQ